MFTDHYKALGIETNSSFLEIKKSYRKLAMTWHPDKNSNANAKEKFIEINTAYLILSDKIAREKYDIELKNYKNNSKIDFRDIDLIKWTKNAESQSEELSNMTFNEFMKILKELGIEFFITTTSSILYAIFSVLLLSSIGSTIFSLVNGAFFLTALSLAIGVVSTIILVKLDKI
jgi:curved DNA-binding protein CbpA